MKILKLCQALIEATSPNPNPHNGAWDEFYGGTEESRIEALRANMVGPYTGKTSTIGSDLLWAAMDSLGLANWYVGIDPGQVYREMDRLAGILGVFPTAAKRYAVGNYLTFLDLVEKGFVDELGNPIEDIT